jgi:quercetin dioxygenase-like cupin family protein
VSAGYEVAHIDELDELPVNNGEFVWRPIRSRFGINAFGTNAYTARAGQRLIEDHTEKDGHEEMYVVLRGRAIFTLGEDEIDAPTGTIVFVRPGTRRGAIATEDESAVLAVGAKPGIVFQPSPWELAFAALSHAERGDLDRARAIADETVDKYPDEWHPAFNAACMEARWGDPERAFPYLEQAVARGGDDARNAAVEDSDFDSIRDDKRFLAITGKVDVDGTGS